MLPDTIEIGYSHGLVFAPDASGVFYCQENQLASGDHTIRFHRFGETTEDPVLFRAARTQSSRLVLTGDGDHLGVTYTYERHRRSLVEMYFAVSEIAPKWHCVFAGREGPAFPYLKNGRIFLYVEREAPNGRLIELNRDGSERCVVVPEGRAKIRDIGFIGSRIYVSHYINDAVQVHSWPIEGMSNGAPGGKLVDLPGGGTIRLISQLGGHGSSLFYSYESFTEPLRFFEYLPVRRMSLALRIAGTRIQNYGFRLRRLLYCSKDGTDIPMSLLTGSAERRSKETPVILTGYGGFGASLTPGFSVFAAITLQLGATFAFPNIRGGGEFGWEWQKAAQGRNRQTAVDDLISAAEWLCSEGITSPEHLGIVGGSNAGLMVGVAIAQRPEMFGAAVCIAPLLDMVRYEQFDRAAAKFREEYGSAKRPEEFQALFSYSPYHSVREGIDYPATLFVSGDRDDHCNPAHVRKMAARLQDRPSQNKPVIVDYSKERGHAPVLPLSIRIKALTRRIGFLCRELNMAVPGEGNHAVD
jgi:prolyl oligopeptidase